MIVRCGIDIVEHNQLAKSMASLTFCKRVFNPSEMALKEIRKRASVFAIKEAVCKALRITPPPWLSIEVSYQKAGHPQISIADELLPSPLITYDCSVSHTTSTTIAVVMLLFDHRKKRK